MKKVLSSLAALIFFAGCGTSIESPQISVGSAGLFSPGLIIVSKDDDTIVEDVIINRGNCELATYESIENNNLVNIPGLPQIHKMKMQDAYDKMSDEEKLKYKEIFPFELAFGKVKVIEFELGCMPLLEVEVITNGGDFTYNLSKN